MTNKYKLTHNTREVLGHTLHQIKALKDFGMLKKGDLGGWVESYDNLSQTGLAWIHGYAMACNYAMVYGDAWVCGKALVYDNAQVFDHAKVCGNAIVNGNLEVCGNSDIQGNIKDNSLSF